jgi:hypothetical protein
MGWKSSKTAMTINYDAASPAMSGYYYAASSATYDYQRTVKAELLLLIYRLWML